MKKLLLSLIGLFAIVSIQAQNHTFRTVDMAVIEKLVKDESSDTYYPKLLERYYDFDTTLTLADYRLLYYGFALQDIYSGYNNPTSERMSDMLDSKEYDDLMEYCDSILKSFPMNIKANLYMTTAMRLSGKEGREKYLERVKMIYFTIYSSGDGYSTKTAFKTIYVDDQYAFMYDFLDIEETKGQALLDDGGEKIDRHSIKKNKNFKKKSIFFNTSETFKGMAKSFK